MLLPVFPVCLGLKDFCKWWLSISSMVIPDLQCHFSVFKLSSQVFLLEIRSPCLSRNTNTLNSSQVSVFLPGSQQHRLYSPSLNHLPHPSFFCTTEEPSSIWAVFRSLTTRGEELSREMSSLPWWGLGCEMTCDTSCSSRNPSPPSHGVENILLFIFWIKLWAFLYGESVP